MDETTINARPFTDEELAAQRGDDPTVVDTMMVERQTRAQALYDEITRLTEENDAKIAEITRYGKTVTPDSVTGVRLMATLDFLLGGMDGSPPGYMNAEFPRLAYEHDVQTRFAAMIEPLLSQVRQAKLTEGIAVQGIPAAGVPAAKLIVPGR